MKNPKKDKTKIPAGHNTGIDPEQQSLFLHHKSAYQRVLEKFKKAHADVRNAGKTIKADGFSLRQVKLAIELDDPEGEAVLRMAIANDLLVARWMNCDVGQQMELFMEPSRVPAADRAYSEGQKCSMENRAAVPPYDPSTEQHARFMAGFHDHQASMITKGIQKLDAAGKAGKPAKGAKAEKAPKAAAAPKPAGKRGRPPRSGKGAAPKDDAPPRKPTAAPVTRASLAADKAAAEPEASSYFSKSTDTAGNA